MTVSENSSGLFIFANIVVSLEVALVHPPLADATLIVMYGRSLKFLSPSVMVLLTILQLQWQRHLLLIPEHVCYFQIGRVFLATYHVIWRHTSRVCLPYLTPASRRHHLAL